MKKIYYLFLLFLAISFQFASTAQSINQGEYFFDSDPGIGNGNQLNVSAADSISISNQLIPTAGLTIGQHTLFIRFKDINGKWSLSEARSFTVACLPTKEYRSKQSGDWSNTATWETYDGCTWIAASQAPSSTDSTISILNGHTVTVNNVVNADELIVNTGGTLVIASNSLTLDNGIGNDLDVFGTVTQNAGTIDGAGSIYFQSGGTFNWKTGVMQGVGTTSALSGSIINFNTGFKEIIGPRVFSNFSSNFTIDFGNIALSNNATFNNSGTINITNDQDFTYVSGSGMAFNNFGTITKNGGVGNTNFNIPFNNTGATINLNSGTINIFASGNHDAAFFLASGTSLIFNSGTQVVTSGSSLSGTGDLKFIGATVTLKQGCVMASTLNVTQSNGIVYWDNSPTLSNFIFSGGILNGAGTLNLSNSFVWKAGSMQGSGTTSVLNTATATLNTTYKDIVGPRSFLNASPNFTLSSGNLQFSDNAYLSNSGAITILTDNDFGYVGGVGMLFDNSGTLTKSSGTGTSNIGIPFNNSGAVNVNSGTLLINGNGINSGTYSVSVGTILSGNIAMSFSGSTFTNNGSVTLAGLNFTGTTKQNLNGNGTISSLALNASSDIDLGGVQRIISTINFNTGILHTGINKLIIDPGAVVGTSAFSWVNGNLQRNFNASGVLLFPIGDSTIYAPIVVTPSISAVGSGGLTARTDKGDHPLISSSGLDTFKSVNRSWQIQNNAAVFDSCSLIFYWSPADNDLNINGNSLQVAKYNAPNWTLLPVLNSSAFSITVPSLTSFGDFQIGNAACSVLPLAGPITGAANVSACTNQLGITYRIDSIPGATNYNWTLPPLANFLGNPDSNVVTVNFSPYSTSANLSVTASNACGPGAPSIQFINFNGIPIAEICGASIDSSSQKTKIEWQKPIENYIKGYVIFRENAGAFVNIDTVLNTAFSSYIDTGSHPAIKAEKYKIAVLDTCGNIGDISVPYEHQTIHLYGSVQPGGVSKLYWNDYVGITDPLRYYNLLRDTSGSGPFNDTLVKNIAPATFMNATDVGSAAYPSSRYVIEMVFTSNCNPSQRLQASRSTSRSNIKNKAALFDSTNVSIHELNIENAWASIFPNPANNLVKISFIQPVKKCDIQLKDMLGKLILSESFNIFESKQEFQIEIQNIQTGVYFMEVNTDKRFSIFKLVKTTK